MSQGKWKKADIQHSKRQKADSESLIETHTSAHTDTNKQCLNLCICMQHDVLLIKYTYKQCLNLIIVVYIYKKV